MQKMRKKKWSLFGGVEEFGIPTPVHHPCRLLPKRSSFSSSLRPKSVTRLENQCSSDKQKIVNRVKQIRSASPIHAMQLADSHAKQQRQKGKVYRVLPSFFFLEPKDALALAQWGRRERKKKKEARPQSAERKRKNETTTAQKRKKERKKTTDKRSDNKPSMKRTTPLSKCFATTSAKKKSP